MPEYFDIPRGQPLRSQWSNIVMLAGAILAFAPVVLVDQVLDSWVYGHEAARLHVTLDEVTAEAQRAVHEGISIARAVVAESPSLCTPTFLGNVHRALVRAAYVRQVTVESEDGVRYCDAYGGLADYEPLTAPLSIAGRGETLAAVQLSGTDTVALKVTYTHAGGRRISSFVHLGERLGVGVGSRLAHADFLRLALTNGTELAAAGDPQLWEGRGPGDGYVVANAFAGEVPVRAEAVLSLAGVRGSYAELGVILTVAACLISASFLVLALRYVQRSQLPAFDLERAIANGEIRPYYQPVIDLGTGRLLGCEMLARWVKPNGKTISPGAFIEYAEVTGLAIPMTISLMEQVRADLEALCHDMGELRVSINLFEGHFRDGSIVEDVQAIFGPSRIGYRQLVFEITERHPLADALVADTVIGGLHALGCRLALDDVGTGHSNLAFMQSLGVDVIKIDRVFVDMVRDAASHVPVLDGLILMARDLGTEIIAEGVETEAQALYLRQRGVRRAQGFLFSPALPAGTFIELARALNADPAPEELAGLAGKLATA